MIAAAGLLASGTLVLGHLTSRGLPGCGLDSPCGHASRSAWSTLPVLGWPVASIAAAYFAASLVAFAISHPYSGWSKWVDRAAAAAAILYIAVALATGVWCGYCVASHACVLALWVRSETASRRASAGEASPRWPAIAGTAVLLATAVATPFAKHLERRKTAEDAARTIAALERPTNPASSSHSSPSASAADIATTNLIGRYPSGAAAAPVQIVVFTGYQCPDCRRLEQALEPLLADPDVSVTIRHFPFCADCNRLVTRTVHPNACWAARAAEAAGSLGGVQGFWAVHRWLFSRSGAFTEAELDAYLATTNFDRGAFLATMQSDATLAAVRRDVDLAASLALNRTPTVFVNNVELAAWDAPGLLRAAIDAARRGTAAAAPRPAAERLIDDWRAQPLVPLTVPSTARSVGDTSAPVQIVVFGDYQDDGTVELDARMRRLAEQDPRIRYVYRHFPADQKCNPTVPRSFHPLACRLARTAESAGAAYGAGAFWKVHAWILAHHRTYTDADLRDLCAENGWDGAKVLRERDSGDAQKRVSEDVAAGQAAGVTELPWVVVNGRRLPRWKLDTGDVLEAVVHAASER